MAERKLRIEIKDLPKDAKISPEEMKKIMAGIGTWPTPERTLYSSSLSYLSPIIRLAESGGGCGCGCG
jgi:hypothetical protein